MLQHVEKTKDTMFHKAASVLVNSLSGLLEIIFKEVQAMHLQILQDLTILNQCYWEVPVSNTQAKRAVLPKVAHLEAATVAAHHACKLRNG